MDLSRQEIPMPMIDVGATGVPVSDMRCLAPGSGKEWSR
jgi:hypothetical protein